jgi:tRNA-dihydrouridine synthase
VKTKLILAPIRGVTTAIYRSVYIKHFDGFDEALAPFIPTTIGDKISTSHLSDILPENNINGLPTTPQLIGNNAEDFVRMANHIHQLGYDSINWNLGCPYPTVVNKKRGAGLLPLPDKIEAFLDKVIPVLKCRLTIKTRLGLNNPDELIALIPLFNNYPVKELIIHPRTAKQSYSGTVDLKRYGACLDMGNVS